MTTRLPVAGVLTITPTKTTRLVTIRCPICRHAEALPRNHVVGVDGGWHEHADRVQLLGAHSHVCVRAGSQDSLGRATTSVVRKSLGIALPRSKLIFAASSLSALTQVPVRAKYHWAAINGSTR